MRNVRPELARTVLFVRVDYAPGVGIPLGNEYRRGCATVSPTA